MAAISGRGFESLDLGPVKTARMVGGVESVLLYYKYVDLRSQQAEVQDWFHELCAGLSLVGRVRVAEDGINVTVGGSHTALLEHIAAVKGHSAFGTGIDFKLARSTGPLNATSKRETGFDGLQVTMCKEVVSLGDTKQCPPNELPARTAQHLSPLQWHLELCSAAEGSSEKPMLLLDARNLYETRIGHFEAEGTQLLEPRLRQFSEFPGWLEENAAALAGGRVMMYCTGGVRCERASALLMSMGPAFQDVCQLEGGIQRYIEQFPSGGFFRGKNFVFDERVAVAPEGGEPEARVGACLVCGVGCDDYSPRRRCCSCRLLVLVCADCCQKVGCDELRCELCVEKEEDVAQQARQEAGRKLRILCLHGFRQTGETLRLRLKRFISGVSDIAEFEFADAPHTLPFLYRPPQDPGKARPLPEIDSRRPRRAWLVGNEQLLSQPSPAEAKWEVAPEDVCAEHHLQQQIEGWRKSSEHLQCILRERGPFDGILGFSQGAAAAAALCAEMQVAAVRGPSQGGSTHPDATSSSHAAEVASPLPFRFAVLCSGYLSRAAENRQALHRIGSISLPSLHVLGRKGADRQVGASESVALAVAFDRASAVVVEHKSRGHYLPADKQSLVTYHKFLRQFIYAAGAQAVVRGSARSVLGDQEKLDLTGSTDQEESLYHQTHCIRSSC